MGLKPMFADERTETSLSTIKENIEMVRGQLYSSKDIAIDEKLKLMEYAVTIQDEGNRKEFVSLIRKWFYLAGVQRESHAMLKQIEEQVNTAKATFVANAQKAKKSQD